MTDQSLNNTDKFNLARLDCFKQKLPDEVVSYLFISNEDWEKAPRKQNGRMVPLLTLNIEGISYIRATHASEDK